MTERETEVLNRFDKYVFENGASNEMLLELIKRAGSFLNLMTIPEYAKLNSMSYEGVKKFRNIEQIFNVKFVIDNV